MLLGNLKVMGEEIKNYPSDFHPQPLFTDIANKYGLRGLYYMDLYPFSDSFLFITDPALALQVQDSPEFDRHAFVNKFLGGIVGTESLFTKRGAEWKRQRSWFAPAFSMAHLLTMVPSIVEETMIFREKLTQHSISGDIFPMTEATVRLTIDVICRSVGNIHLKSQTEYSAIQYHFGAAISWTAGHTAPMWHKLASSTMMNYHTKKVDKLLEEVIKAKYKGGNEDGVSKTILDLAYKGYTKDNGKLGEGKKMAVEMDPVFMKIAIDKYA